MVPPFYRAQGLALARGRGLGRVRGYARPSTGQGNLLRTKLQHAGWQIVNDTVLPLVCFVDPGGADPETIVRTVNASGRARIFSTTIPPGRRVVRACITNHRTRPEDLDVLIESLRQARSPQDT